MPLVPTLAGFMTAIVFVASPKRWIVERSIAWLNRAASSPSLVLACQPAGNCTA
jgi:hypothetical protein